jgi:glycosyltransferase involved in cell wall biosynthesis
MKEMVVILDFQGVISNGGRDVVTRHRMYADKLYETSNQRLSLRIITSRDKEFKNSDEQELFLQLGSGKSSYLRNILALRRFVNSNQNIRLIVAGDVFKSGLQALLSQLFINEKIPIQFQVHADIGAPGWASTSLANKLKFLVGAIVLRNARYVRAVSKRQASNLRRLTGKGTVVQVVPVPLNIPNGRMSKSKAQDQFRIGILGRIQKDRGIAVFDQFVREAAFGNEKVKYLIAGNGPDDSLLLEIQQRLSDRADFHNMGFLEGNELATFWNETDCLLNLAPFESYGRSMREAVSLGIRVISTPNSGALDLLDEVGSKWISLWSPNQDLNPGKLIQRIIKLKKGNEKPPHQELIGSEIDLLIQSWLDCL